METLQLFIEDKKIAEAIINRDEAVTRDYFYRQCYPLFKTIYNNYYTDCEDCLEFMNEIYVHVLTPSPKTGRCQMENFKGESTLANWLKAACLYYCYGKYKRKKRMNIVKLSQNPFKDDNEDRYSDRLIDAGGSSTIDMTNIDKMDVVTILNLMPCKRYSQLIRLRYMENKTNEETAEILGINMDNYYNVHKRAKSQYERICGKEEFYG